tara:strand:- start:8 stop:418 length:411 start_codon:yes stop_codon:yes gene_type:complete
MPKFSKKSLTRLAVLGIAIGLLIFARFVLFPIAERAGILEGGQALGDTYRMVADIEEINSKRLSVSTYEYASEPGRKVQRRVSIVEQTEVVITRNSQSSSSSTAYLRKGQRIRIHTAQDPESHDRITAKKIEVFAY